LQNSFGLRRYFYGVASRSPKHTLNQALNFIPQSTVAAMMWYLLVPLEKCIERYGGHLLSQIHDSFVWEVPAVNAEAAVKAVARLMERPWDMIAPGWSCPTDAAVGPTWGAANAMEGEAPEGMNGLEYWISQGRPAWKGTQ